MARQRLAIPVDTVVRFEKLTTRRRRDAARLSPPSDFDPDGLRPARGILNGLVASGAMWLLIAWFVWLICR